MKRFSRRKFGFQCSHCKQWVVVNDAIGTRHRNHCPLCLWSLHVDLKKPGDRASFCHGSMEPVGLVFKDEGIDKYGKKRIGEIMLVHYCLNCHKTTANRIAADDNSEKFLEVFEKSKTLDAEIQNRIESENYILLKENDRAEIERQLFGKE